MSCFSPEIVQQDNFCECYKKLEFIGLPLYKKEEDKEYGEGHEDILYESCFQLPGVLKINPQIIEYPVVDDNKLPAVFCKMAQVIPNLSDFELNNLSFWILDMFVEGLWTAQKAGMNHDHQRATLLWIAYLFNYIQRYFKVNRFVHHSRKDRIRSNVAKKAEQVCEIAEVNPTRKEVFLHLKMVLFATDLKKNEYLEEEMRDLLSESNTFSKEEDNLTINFLSCELPLPPGTMEPSTESDFSLTEDLAYDVELSEVNEEVKITDTQTNVEEDETVCEKNTRHMKIILEILYRIFARLWVFLEIQTAFHAMPSVEHVNLPFKLGKPKPRAKIDSFAASKAGRKTSAFEGLSEEMEMEKQLHKNDYILPLQAAEESKAYMKQIFAPASDRSIFSKGKDKKK